MNRMKIVVIGAGQVGKSVATELAKIHDLVVIDSDSERLDALRYAADVMTLEGDGADLEILQEAGVSEADIIIASTDDDRVNILVCGIARMLSESLFTICRVADTAYLKSWERTKKAFQVDLMVGSNFLTAVSIVGVITEQLATDVAYFDEGRIEMAEFLIPDDCEFAGQQIKDSNVPAGLRFAAVFDGKSMEVAGGNTLLKAGNRLLVIGRADEVGKFSQRLARKKSEVPEKGLKKWLKKKSKEAISVFILGGGEVGFQTAKLLEKKGISPKVVESDAARADFLAKSLPKSFVLHDNIRDPKFLKTEGIGRADLVIVALKTDELNLFGALLVQHLGAKKVVSVLHDTEYQELFKQYGIDLTFNPRTEVIKEIIRHTRGKRLEKIAFVEDHRGEVIQLKLQEGSALIGRPLQECMEDLPSKLVIGAVSRKGQVIIPHGKTILQEDDDLVIFVDTNNVADLMERL